MHCNVFDDVVIVETKLCAKFLFPSLYLGWTCGTVYPHSSEKAPFHPPVACELRLASENGPQQKSPDSVLCLSIYGTYCYVKCPASVNFRDMHVYPTETLLIERFLAEFFKLQLSCPDWIHESSFDREFFDMWPLCYCAGGRSLFEVNGLTQVYNGHCCYFYF